MVDGRGLGARPVGGPCNWHRAGSARQCAFNETRSDSPLPALIVSGRPFRALPERVVTSCKTSSPRKSPRRRRPRVRDSRGWPCGPPLPGPFGQTPRLLGSGRPGRGIPPPALPRPRCGAGGCANLPRKRHAAMGGSSSSSSIAPGSSQATISGSLSSNSIPTSSRSVTRRPPRRGIRGLRRGAHPPITSETHDSVFGSPARACTVRLEGLHGAPARACTVRLVSSAPAEFESEAPALDRSRCL
jgi:hypothetical protein